MEEVTGQVGVFRCIPKDLGTPMTSRKRYAFWIEDNQLEALNVIKQRDGVLPSEQIRRALDDWFKKKGAKVKTERKQAGTRKRS